MKKIMVCVDLKNESINLLKAELKKIYWKDVSEIHFVHGFQLQVYTDNFFFTTYPDEQDYKSIEKSVNDVLGTLAKDIFNTSDKSKAKIKCILSSSPKEALAEYVTSNNISEMIIGTRGKTGVAGLFSSSFAEYMVRHAHCNLRIVRDR